MGKLGWCGSQPGGLSGNDLFQADFVVLELHVEEVSTNAHAVATANDVDVGGVGSVGRDANLGNICGGIRGGTELRMRHLT